jgi:hypothetical protein
MISCNFHCVSACCAAQTALCVTAVGAKRQQSCVI